MQDSKYHKQYRTNKRNSINEKLDRIIALLEGKEKEDSPPSPKPQATKQEPAIKRRCNIAYCNSLPGTYSKNGVKAYLCSEHGEEAMANGWKEEED